jgi:hypothetical protein
MLSDAGRSGNAKAVLMANGFSAEMLASLVGTGLATATIYSVRLGSRTIKVPWMRITDAGQWALGSQAGMPCDDRPQAQTITIPRRTYAATIEVVGLVVGGQGACDTARKAAFSALAALIEAELIEGTVDYPPGERQ